MKNSRKCGYIWRKTLYFKLLCSVIGIIILTSCSNNSSDRSQSSGLSSNVVGTYYREYKESKGYYYLIIRDTIKILRKDVGFEVQNRQWFVSSDKPEDPYFRIPGFKTYQATLNNIDSTLSSPFGSSLKFNLDENFLYIVDQPMHKYLKQK